MLRKICSIIALLSVFAVALCGCGEKTAKKRAFNIPDNAAVPSDNLKIAENENFLLNIDSETCGILLTDKKTGAVYGTTPSDGGEVEYDELGMPISRHPQVKSPLMIDYYDTENNTAVNLISFTGAVSEGNIRCALIKDGARIEYYFSEAEIMIPVIYTLKKDGVHIEIKSSEITENKNMLISVSLAPYFCSAKNTAQSSYLFYPSGSGALIYPKAISASATDYSAQVYGEDASIEHINRVTEERKISMPVYGMKNGSNAIVAIIDEAPEAAEIKARIGSTSIGYSAVYTSFVMRSATSTVKELYSGNYHESLVYADNLITTDLGISFYPLSGEKASYVGMAQKYSEYLTDKYGDKKSDAATLDLTFIGGTLIKKSFLGVPYTTLYKATTVNQVEESLKKLYEKGVSISDVALVGFGSSGIDSGKAAGGFSVASKLGSKKDVNALAELCKKNETAMFIDYDLLSFSKGNTYFGTAKRTNGKLAKTYIYDMAIRQKDDTVSSSLAKREKLNGIADKLISKTKYSEYAGFGISSLSSTAYSDYSDKVNSKYYSKLNMAKQTAEIISGIKKAGRGVLSSEPNDYAAVNSSANLSVSTVSSGETVFDADVPFYQMALRGKTRISAESLNLAYDSDVQLLKCIESGSGLGFTLSCSWDNELLDSDYPVFYSSLFEDNLERIVSAVQKTEDYYKAVGASPIVGHRILSENLRETVFASGVAVYVNYGKAPAVSPAGEVKPLSYLIKGATE